MAKVFRRVRVEGPVVTLGRREVDSYEKLGESNESAIVDFAALLGARIDEVRKELDSTWQGRLSQERGELGAVSQASLEKADARHQEELKVVSTERYEAGHRDGVRSMEEQACEAVQRLEEVRLALVEERGQVLREAERTIVNLSVALAKRVTDLNTEIDDEVVARVLRTALSELCDDGNLVAKVHPKDLEVARRFASQWTERVGSETILKVVSSDYVGRGGCMIEGTEENVDARIDTQYELLREALHAIPSTAEGIAGKGPSTSREDLEAKGTDEKYENGSSD